MATGILPGDPADGAPEAAREHRALAWAAAASLAVIFWLVRPIGLGILIGTLLAFLAQPACKRLTARIGARWAVLTTVIASGFAVAATLGGLGWLFVSRGTVLAARLVAAVGPRGFVDSVVTRAGGFTARFGVSSDQLLDHLRGLAGDAASSAERIAAAIASTTASALLGLLFAMLAMHYILRNGERVSRRIADVVPLRPAYTVALVAEFRRVGRELAKVDEIPFDFERRIMSVVVRTPEGKDLIISKGAPEAIFSRCTSFELDGKRLAMDHPHIIELTREHERLSSDGFRVLALATREMAPRATSTGVTPYGKADESELVLQGYVAFLDPPKETCAAAIGELHRHGVTVKVITGDNELVARKVCKDVGLAVDLVLLGTDIEQMTDEQLADAAEVTTLFARVSPAHKHRIIKALQSHKHTVGFMGDGINDAPALHAADVGISVDTAVDIAKASADMILLEQSLRVIDEGVLEGRKVFANISKYVRMGASSNFGNMFSVLGASIFVPFLPMLPIQILSNNLLYDISQTTIPTDDVDAEQIQKPRPWDIKALTRFIVFIGPCSSIFDYTTYFVMLYGFGCWDVSTASAAAHSASLFQTGWFVESLITQALVIHVIRTNKLPFVHSRASPSVIAAGLLIIAVGIVLPFSFAGRYLGFTRLPSLYWPILAVTLACYLLLTQGVKSWLLRRRWI